jgi:hypothetical protein
VPSCRKRASRAGCVQMPPKVQSPPSPCRQASAKRSRSAYTGALDMGRRSGPRGATCPVRRRSSCPGTLRESFSRIVPDGRSDWVIAVADGSIFRLRPTKCHGRLRARFRQGPASPHVRSVSLAVATNAVTGVRTVEVYDLAAPLPEHLPLSL